MLVKMLLMRPKIVLQKFVKSTDSVLMMLVFVSSSLVSREIRNSLKMLSKPLMKMCALFKILSLIIVMTLLIVRAGGSMWW